MKYPLSEIFLRRPLPADAPDALAMILDPEVVRWNPAPNVIDLPSAVAWCERGADWSNGRHATLHAIHEPSGRLLGNISVHAIEESSHSARIGYRVAPWARRQGIGTATVAAVARWSFSVLPITCMTLLHDHLNDVSCRLAASAGFRAEGSACSLEAVEAGVHAAEHVHVRGAADRVDELPGSSLDIRASP